MKNQGSGAQSHPKRIMIEYKPQKCDNYGDSSGIKLLVSFAGQIKPLYVKV